MSGDHEMPAWASAFADMLERRIVPQVSQALAATEDRLEQRIEEMRAEMTCRFDQVDNGLTGNLPRADAAISG